MDRRLGALGCVVALLCAGLAIGGCGSDTESPGTTVPGCTTSCGPVAPAYVAGDYTVQITNGDNGCGFEPWKVGDTTSGVSMVLTQQGASSAVTGAVTGASALYLDIALGSHVLTGSVAGFHLELMLNGTRDYHRGACTYTIVANMSADLQGDALAGRIAYTAATNRSPECGLLTSCTSLQSFNGTRPPAPPTGR